MRNPESRRYFTDTFDLAGDYDTGDCYELPSDDPGYTGSRVVAVLNAVQLGNALHPEGWRVTVLIEQEEITQ